MLLVLENLDLMIIRQESLGTENRQIHPVFKFIHRNDVNFLYGIQSISEVALVWPVLKENGNNNLFGMISWHQ
jgi:hypothetical protein